MIDEAAVAAVAGELSPYATGIVYCITIVTCRDMADYRRAGEWTDATTRWCERQSICGFPGHCRVRRAEIMRLRGAFADAEVEARRRWGADGVRRAADRRGGFPRDRRVRMRMGDLAGAEEAFAQAHSAGTTRSPGSRCSSWREGARSRPGRRSAPRSPTSPWRSPGRACSRRRSRSRSRPTTRPRRARPPRSCATSPAPSTPRRGTRAPARRWARASRRGRGGGGDRRAPQGGPRVDRGRPAVRDGAGQALARLRPPAGGDEESAAVELRSALATFERLGADERRRRRAPR